MSKAQLNIMIYSDSKDTSLISTAVSQIESPCFEQIISTSNKLNTESPDFIIAQIGGRDSKILNQIIENRDQLSGKIIFALTKNDGLLTTTLAKLGFNELFLFPDELFQFTTYMTEQIENYSNKKIPLYASHDISSLIGKGENSVEQISIAKKVASNPDINLMIYGETGTGKGLLANAIHNYNKKNPGPFVQVICTAIPDTLLESELFGYEKGAFTDAKNRKIGLLELAENGTVFLDEIGDMNLGLQAKLLNVIEKKVFKRLGGVENIPLEARIISATNRNLAKMVEQKLFRIDLYFRLNIVSIKLKPLRERKDEIIPIANSMIDKFCEQYNKTLRKIENDVYNFIKSYRWPGNLREFRNTIEMAIVMLDGNTLKLNYFKNFIQNVPNNYEEEVHEMRGSSDTLDLAFNYNSVDLLKVNKIYAKTLLEKLDNNKSKTAKLLGISRPKLDSLLKN